MSALGKALFTRTQQELLGLLFSQPEKSFYTKEILRLTGMGVATIKRELDNLVASGILTLTKIGNQHHFQANPDCPIYSELLSIVKKTLGVSEVIRLALVPMTDQIDWAFIFGSVASGKESSASDIDLMVIGEVGFGELVKALYPEQDKLSREINPKIYSRLEWKQMLDSQDAFVKEVQSKPRINVIGDGHEFGKLSGKES